MAEKISKIEKFLKTPTGKILSAFVYAAMLLAVMMFFTGNGEFIYEAF